MTKPKALGPGSRIGIVAPSAPVDPRKWFEDGVNHLKNLGLKTKKAKGLMRRKSYLAGDDSVRASQINDMFTDKSIDGIICARGGSGVPRILDQIDYDVIRKNPKALIGYSDVTALSLAMWKKCKLVTFSGSMVARGWDTPQTGMVESFISVLGGFDVPEWEFKASEFKIYSKGKARGRLLGGNLTVLCNMLGTPYIPDFKGAILFIEDIGEEPEKLDRMFAQLRLSGILQRVAAVLLGDFSSCVRKKDKAGKELQFVLNDYFKSLGVPVVGKIPFGHIDDVITIPYGVRAEVDTSKRTLKLLERPVHQR